MIKRFLLAVVLITFFLSYTNSSLADTLTPPKILSIDQGFDDLKRFKTGDLLAFNIKFSSDLYGLKNLSIEFISKTGCIQRNIYLGPGGINGNSSKGVSDDPNLDIFGRLAGNSFTFFGELRSSCFVGTNDFTVRTNINDFSNLYSSFERNFKVEVVNGLAKRPGESRGPDQALEVVDYSQLLIGKRLLESTLKVVLPSFSKEGVSLNWTTRGGSGGSAMCQIWPKTSPESFSQILVIRDSNPNNPLCELIFYSDESPLDLYSFARGEIHFYLLKGELVTISKYEQTQRENQKKKTTITCVKGKLVKKVTAVKPKCPSGYKIKK